MDINRDTRDLFGYKATVFSNKLKRFQTLGMVGTSLLVVTGVIYLGLTSGTTELTVSEQSLEPPPLVAPAPLPREDSLLESSLPFYQIQAHHEELIRYKPVAKAPFLVKKKTATVAFRPVKQRNVKPAVHRLAKQQSNPSYTIQLLASHDVNQLRAFVVAHHLQGRTEIHQTKHRGKAWYVLTLGHYPQKKNARDVLKQLPSDVAQYKPWTRPVSEITAMG